MTAVTHNGGDGFAVYCDRSRHGAAYVTIYRVNRRSHPGGPVASLGAKLADYETDSRGATASARRELARLIAIDNATGVAP